MLAVLFAGQGDEIARLLPDWEARSAAVRRLLELAAAEVGIPRDGLHARGGRALHRTEILQPAMTALSLGIWEELRALGVEPGVVAGHSLGEIAAVSAAGAFSPEDAVSFAALRGRAMAREAARHAGGMVACHGSAAAVDRALQAAGLTGAVDIAALNTPDQTVVAGPITALRRLGSVIPTTRLDVAGPWHHRDMRGAVAEVRADAERRIRGPLRIPWISNRHGDPVESASDVARLLAEQLVCPVQWVRTVRTLGDLGVRRIITVASKSLRGLVRDCPGRPAVHSVTRPDALATLIPSPSP
ncbi:MAG: acyltransferase domain-containing protein [Gammaproteobacteria bacterium]|nr:ACP S-malonyltransferase [Gemmatimonadota bacterium]NIR39665.1 ACP S-malonyltransferase [Actinomycetota bacterium]NIU77814.1 acyltransferase domain-containing protein [Gammaproteobacteria bacterium]NIY11295.1 acyltransferase domain-containing protein [Gemmatimonadota bacterium]